METYIHGDLYTCRPIYMETYIHGDLYTWRPIKAYHLYFDSVAKYIHYVTVYYLFIFVSSLLSLVNE